MNNILKKTKEYANHLNLRPTHDYFSLIPKISYETRLQNDILALQLDALKAISALRNELRIEYGEEAISATDREYELYIRLAQECLERAEECKRRERIGFGHNKSSLGCGRELGRHELQHAK